MHVIKLFVLGDFQVVKIWDYETGNAIFEYGDAHGDEAITCCTFDSTSRRYGILASRRGYSGVDASILFPCHT